MPYEAKGSGLQYSRVWTSADLFCQNSFTQPTPRTAFLRLVLCRLFNAKAGFGKQWNATKGFWTQRRLFQIVSLSLSFPLSPLSEILELEPRTLSLTKELALHRSNMCLHLTWVAWGKSVEFWILIYLSNRDKNIPIPEQGLGVLQIQGNVYYKCSWLPLRQITFLFLHSLHQRIAKIFESIFPKESRIYWVRSLPGDWKLRAVVFGL